MNSLVEFWNEQCAVKRPLEGDSWLRRLLNRHVVGTLLNAFPRAATGMFSLSRGELARRVCVDKEGGSYRVFQAMYAYDDPRARGDLLNRLLMESPAAKAARNRRTIAQGMLEACLRDCPNSRVSENGTVPLGTKANAGPTLVMAVGGGDGSLEAEVISRAANPNVYYCSVDKDETAVEANRRVMAQNGLAGKGFVFTGDVAKTNDFGAVVEAARRRFDVSFDGIGIAVCHGIAEYLDLGRRGNDAFARLLQGIRAAMRPEGSLVISHTDYHDRVKFVERGLQWQMRLRSLEELETEIQKAGWQIVVCEHEPMKLITLCLAVQSNRPRVRIDGPSQLRHSRTSQPARATISAGVVGQ